MYRKLSHPAAAEREVERGADGTLVRRFHLQRHLLAVGAVQQQRVFDSFCRVAADRHGVAVKRGSGPAFRRYG